MGKRKLSVAELDHGEEHSSKRARPNTADHLSSLSDELLLRVLSYLSLSELNVSRTISRKFNRLAGDSHLWKALYYDRFVRPRVARLPGIDPYSANLHFSSRFSKWPEDEILVKSDGERNWKYEYKKRHNWSKGACDVSEIEVAERPPIPPLLVCLHEGVVYTADSISGLRAWSSRKERKLLGSIQFPGLPETSPTSLAVDVKGTSKRYQRVVVGFDDGSFTIFGFALDSQSFFPAYTHAPSSEEMISAAAYCSPYLITMTATQLISLFKFAKQPGDDKHESALEAPELLYALKSHSVLPPLALGIRATTKYIFATLAFSTPTFQAGWSVSVQEMRLTLEGALLDSRMVTSTPDQPTLSSSLPSSLRPSRASSPFFSSPFSAAAPCFTKPTSISYSHPYLLLSHPDNTLTLYLLTSTPDALSISSGSRLWGHTSSVAGAQIGSRGKAISVSRRGDEVRIWDLEGTTNRKAPGSTTVSVKIQPEKREHVNSKIPMDDLEDITVVRGWVGFDDENVVVLKERNLGSQALVVYDFT